MTDFESPQNRLGYIDTLKAFAIFMVLIGHLTDNSILEQYIFSFHLPLFFWVSGFLFNPIKYQHFGSFLRQRLKTLVVPYFIFAFISFLFWFFVVRGLSVRGQVNLLNPWYPFWGIFYGIGVEPWRNPLDVALWFLPCLFVTEIIFWHINKYMRGSFYFVALILSAIIGYVTSISMEFRLPWSADVAFTAVVFYAVGNMAKNRVADKVNFNMTWAIIALTSLAVGFLLSVINGKVDMNYNYYGNPFLFYCSAFAGIVFWFYIMRILPPSKVMAYVGKNTIIIVGLAGISSFVLRGLLYLLSNDLLSMGKMGIAVTFVYSVFQISLLVPVMYVINRYAPFIVGRDQRARSML